MSLPSRSMEDSQASTMNIKDFRTIFNIFNNFLVIFGLSSLQPFYKFQQIHYKLSYKCVVYSIGISGLIIYVFYIQIMDFKVDSDSLVLSLLNLYLTVVGTLMAILMVTTAIFNASNFAELINDFEYFEIFTLLKSYRILIWASAKQLFLSFSILSLCYMWDVLSTGHGFDFKLAITILMYFLFPIYNSLCISQFYIILFWLGQLYLIINKGLIRLAGKHEFEGAIGNINQLPSYIIFGISEMAKSYESLPPTLVNRYEENSQTTQMASIAAVISLIKIKFLRHNHCRCFLLQKMKVKDIQTLRKLYHKIFKLTLKINYIFSSRNLLLILHHCALGTVYLYWAIRHSLPGMEISMTGLLNLYRASVMSLVSIMWLIWPSTTTVQEVSH